MTSTRKPVVSATTPTVPLVDNKSGQISWAWLKWFQGLGAAVNAALNQDGGLNPPTLTTLGGVFEADSAPHEFLTEIDNTGQPHLAQPAFDDISGIAASSQIPAATPADLGGITADLTAGFIPKATGASGIANSPLDDGITLPGTVSSSGPIAAPSEAIGAFLTSAGISVIGETLDVFSSVPGGIQAVFWGAQDPTNSNYFFILIPMWGYVPGSPGTLGNDFAGFGYNGTIDNAGNVSAAYMYFISSLANGFDNILIDQAGDVGIGGSAMNNASINPQDGVLYIPVTGPAKFTRPLQSTGRVKNLNIQTISYTILAIDEIVQMNAAGATTVTLDNTVPASGQVFAIKNVGAGTCTVQPSSGNIDNHASLALTQWQGMEVYWDGTLWRVLSQALSV